MRLLTLSLLLNALVLAGCSSTAASAPLAATEQPTLYPDLGDAPELGYKIWLNTPKPLRLVDLRGKVVLIDMWTFG